MCAANTILNPKPIIFSNIFKQVTLNLKFAQMHHANKLHAFNQK